MKTLVIGCHHRSATVDIREMIAFDGDNVSRALNAFREQYPQCQVILLSTCNRMEFFLAAPIAAAPGFEDVVDFIAAFHNIKPKDFAEGLFHCEDTEAVNHLFRVCSSLDSMVLGETQITNQVKAAYDIAKTTGSIGAELDMLFQKALGVAKEVRTKTAIAEGRLSVGSAAVDLARQIFSRFDDKRIMMVGAGKMGELTLTHLLDTKPKELLVTNRTVTRAQELAKRINDQHGVSPTIVPFEEWIDRLADVDIVISSTGAHDPIITPDQFKPVAVKRKYRPILFVDIAVPRDIHAGLDDYECVYLYNIDHLQSVVEETLASRKDAIDECQQIVDANVAAFIDRLSRRQITPVMAALEERFKAISDAELQRALPKFNGLDENDRELIQHMLHRVTKKLLHGPMKTLNAECRNEILRAHTDALKAMFDLEENTDKK